jgi:DNA modification methylase
MSFGYIFEDQIREANPRVKYPWAPNTELVYAAYPYGDNSELILTCAELGYLEYESTILDPTYGQGNWWKLWQPAGLVGDVAEYSDFKNMGHPDEAFDAVAFDPPYVSVGGRKTSTLPEFQRAYGMDTAPLTPAKVQRDINLGLEECFRVVKKGGVVLVKCQNYVSSGKLWKGVYYTERHAIAIGFNVVDELIHLSGGRPQPAGHGEQQHARNNYSVMLVLRRPKR